MLSKKQRFSREKNNISYICSELKLNQDLLSAKHESMTIIEIDFVTAEIDSLQILIKKLKNLEK